MGDLKGALPYLIVAGAAILISFGITMFLVQGSIEFVQTQPPPAAPTPSGG